MPWSIVETTMTTFLTRIPLGPKGMPWLGSLPAFLADRLGFVRAAAQYGDVVNLSLGPLSGYLVTHPDLIKLVLVDRARTYLKGNSPEALKVFLGDGLVASDGEVWLRQRRIMQPAFHRKAIAGVVSTVVDVVGRTLDELPSQGRIALQPQLNRITMEVAARVFFGSTVRGDAAMIERSSSIAISYLSRRALSPIRVPSTWQTPGNRRFRQAQAELDELIYGIINDRKHTQPDQPDLLDLLIHAEDAETGERLSDRQLRDQVISLFLAGFETTSLALAWTWSLLGQHPNVRAQLYEEVDRVLGSRPPTAEDLSQLRYTRQVIEETLRLYPPIWIFWRTATQPDTLGEYHVPARQRVYLSPLVTHRLPELWDEPDEFRPERFDPELDVRRPRFAYFPFSGGPRQCIGNAFAMMEAQIVLAMMAQRHMYDLDGPAPKPDVGLTLKPDRTVWMRVTPR